MIYQNKQTMTNELTFRENDLIKLSIRTRIMWIENNFINDTYSDLAYMYQTELEDLKKLLEKFKFDYEN